MTCADAVPATSLEEYRKRLEQAVTALDTLAYFDETESESARASRIKGTIAAVRTTVPETENVEWDGTVFRVDNSWFHRELTQAEAATPAEQSTMLANLAERLQALTQRLTDIEKAQVAESPSKAEARQKLSEILQREEYARNRPEVSALTRLLNKLMKWLRDLFPKPRAPSSGGAGFLTQVAQILVVLLAVGVIIYAVRLFAPRIFMQRRSRKKQKRGPRIVLGEKLEPDQSARGLLAEAEALAHRGEVRAAIRKAYIALLVELGERKILSLAQHKTNRDYLGAVRDREPLYGYVRQLTHSFERHWYGLTSASEADWVEFRDTYGRALTH